RRADRPPATTARRAAPSGISPSRPRPPSLKHDAATEKAPPQTVIPGLDPGIHGFLFVDGRVEPGHDALGCERRVRSSPSRCDQIVPGRLHNRTVRPAREAAGLPLFASAFRRAAPGDTVNPQ